MKDHKIDVKAKAVWTDIQDAVDTFASFFNPGKVQALGLNRISLEDDTRLSAFLGKFGMELVHATCVVDHQEALGVFAGECAIVNKHREDGMLNLGQRVALLFAQKNIAAITEAARLETYGVREPFTKPHRAHFIRFRPNMMAEARLELGV